jgi:hypothetical protein
VAHQFRLTAALSLRAPSDRIVPTSAHEPISPGSLEELRAAYPHPERLLVALRLARDIHTCRALLRGEPVDPDRVDKHALRHLRERMLVRLDFPAIDLLTRSAE